MKPTIPLCLLSLCALACAHPLYEVTPDAQRSSAEGVVYSLPTKQLVVEVEVTKTETKHGKWACLNPWLGLPMIDQHKKLCGELSVPKPDELESVDDKHTITAIRVGEQVVPDPAARFHISLPNKRVGGRDRDLQFTLTEAGVLSKSDAVVINRRPEMIAASVRTTSNIIGKVIGVVAKTFTGSLPSDKISEVVEKPNDKSVFVCTVPVPDACAAAARLHKLVGERDRLLTTPDAGISMPSGDAELVRLKKLDAEIDALRALFYPSQKKTVHTWVQVVAPAIGTTTWTWCLTETGSLTTNGCKADKGVELVLDGLPAERKVPGKEVTGIRYRVPPQGQLTATLDGKPVVSRSSTFPQFGDIQTLPHSVYGRHNQLVVELSAVTGMLTQLRVVDKRDRSDVIDAAGEGTGVIVDATGSAIDARQAADDPAKLQQRELEQLEFARQISCYEQTGGPCP